MSSLCTKSRKVKSSSLRSLRVSDAIHGVRTLVITQDGDRTFYDLKEIGVDFGRGFRVDKCAEGTGSDRDSSGYDVHLDAQLGDSCTCKGHTYKGKCKHVDSIKTLVNLGKL
jgi:hypothetical protein